MTADNRMAGAKPLLVSLQYLRAIAAFMVVYFHAVLQLRLFAGGRTAFPLIGSGGVDIFFVLSGFMMWFAVEGRATKPGEFLRRRIVRVAPLYWLVTLAALAVAGVAPALLRSTVFDPAHALASIAFVPWRNPGLAALGATETIVPVVVPGWTLNFEMMFYLLFGMTLAAPKRLRIPVLGMLLLGLFVASRLASVAVPAFGFYHRDILFEFMIGAMLGAMGLHRRPLSGGIACCIAIAGFAILLGLELAGIPPVPRLFLYGVPATMILLAALHAEASGSVAHVSVLNALGDASFSIYLTHGFVLAALRIVAVRLGLGGDTVSFQAGFILTAIAATAAVGLAICRIVEQPLIRIVNRLTSPGHGKCRVQAPRMIPDGSLT